MNMDETDGGGSIWGQNGDTGGGVTGDMESRMENADGNSGTSALQSMGDRNDETGMGQRGGESTGSTHSVLQMVFMIIVAVFFGGSLLYFLITGLLAMFGVPL